MHYKSDQLSIYEFIHKYIYKNPQVPKTSPITLFYFELAKFSYDYHLILSLFLKVYNSAFDGKLGKFSHFHTK